MGVAVAHRTFAAPPAKAGMMGAAASPILQREERVTVAVGVIGIMAGLTTLMGAAAVLVKMAATARGLGRLLGRAAMVEQIRFMFRA